MSFPRYPAYKPSGVEWLGEVPEHWEVKPVFAVARERNEDNKGMKEDNLLSLSYGSIVNKDINTSDGLLPESFETYQIVSPGDIVLRLTDLQNDKRSLRSALATQRGIITSAYLALQPKDIESRYLSYLLRAYDASKVFYSMGGGLRQSMKFADVKRMPLVLPGKIEQTGISAFLDRETAKVDALIAEQQRLIELLQEKRQAVISHAVTKGLNPDAPMKDSGVEWLGEVPEHWEVKRLKDIAEVIDCRNKTPEYFEAGDYLVVRTSNIKRQTLALDDALYTDRRNFEIWTQRGIPQPGSILFTREAPTGEVCLVPEGVPLCMGQRMMNFVCHVDSFTGFLMIYLQSDCLTRYIESTSHGSTVSHLRVSQVENIPVVVPAQAEVQVISSHIDKLSSGFNALINEATHSISLIQERRSALISAAVTGQIDVRGLVPEVEAA